MYKDEEPLAERKRKLPLKVEVEAEEMIKSSEKEDPRIALQVCIIEVCSSCCLHHDEAQFLW